MLWLLLKVKALSFGCFIRQVSCILREILTSLSAVMAFSLSLFARARSMGSSVRLKSPIMKSRGPISSLAQSELILFQKAECSLGLFGA